MIDWSIKEQLRYAMYRLNGKLKVLYRGEPCTVYIEKGHWWYTQGRTSYATTCSQIAYFLEIDVMEILPIKGV